MTTYTRRPHSADDRSSEYTGAERTDWVGWWHLFLFIALIAVIVLAVWLARVS